MPAYKRGQVWHVRFEVDGQKFSKSMGPSGTKADAVAYEAKVRADILAGNLGRPQKHTIDEAIDKWLDGEGRRLASRTSLSNMAGLMKPHIFGRPLTEVVVAAQDVRNAGIDEGLAVATINRRIAILRRVANLAYDQWGWLSEPLGRKIKTGKGEVKRRVFLSPDEVEALAQACEHEVVAKAIRLYARTGLREAELLKATEIRDGFIVVSSRKGRGEERVRLVPVPADTPDLKLPLGITYNTLRHYFEKARKKVGREEVHVHDLRHTTASWLAQSGASLVIIRDMLGHTSFAETTRYSHLMPSDLRKAADAMGMYMTKHTAVQQPDSNSATQ